jgi:RNA polymerase sigma-70 factor (ECF subfamily)
MATCQRQGDIARVSGVSASVVEPAQEEKLGTDDFESFFTRGFPRVARVAARIVGFEGGEDVAIEALARAYARWGSVSRLDKPEAWVMRVATNLAVDQVRKKPVYGTPRQSKDLEDTVTDREVVRSSIAKLPRRQRQVVALRYLADMPEGEVAQVLDVSTGAVKTHLHRALAALRLSLAQDKGGDDDAARS